MKSSMKTRAGPEMFVTVITPARNAAETIERCVTSVLGQRFEGDFEYIVVEGGSTDETRQIIERCLERAGGKLRLFKGPGIGPAAARNVGIKKAGGDIIVFIDADCEASEWWLRSLIQPFQWRDVGGVCGTVKTPKGLGLVGGVVGLDWEYRQEEKIVKRMRWFHFMNTAYRREVFRRIGLLDEALTTGEDQEFFRRALSGGYKFFFVEGAMVYHYHRSTLRRFLSQFFNYGKGSYTALRRGGDLETLPLFLYFLLLLGSLALISLRQIFGYVFLALFALGFGKYLLDSLQVFYRSRELLSLLIGPLAYLGRFAKFLGFIYSLLRVRG